MRAATVLLLAAAIWPATAAAATWGELGRAPSPSASGQPGPYGAVGPYANPAPYGACPQCGPMTAPTGGSYGAPMGSPLGMEGRPPAAFDAPGRASAPPEWSVPPEAMLPMTQGGLPNGAVQMGTFGQINSTTDPYNSWGLSTPFMFVPWSTPLSGWTNAQTWNWWRTRSGVRSPAW